MSKELDYTGLIMDAGLLTSCWWMLKPTTIIKILADDREWVVERVDGLNRDQVHITNQKEVKIVHANDVVELVKWATEEGEKQFFDSDEFQEIKKQLNNKEVQ